MPDGPHVPSARRVVPHANGEDLDAPRAFYADVLGLEVAMEEPVLGLTSPANRSAQVLVPPTGFDDPQPQFGVDLGAPEAVDAARRRGAARTARPLSAQG